MKKYFFRYIYYINYIKSNSAYFKTLILKKKTKELTIIYLMSISKQKIKKNFHILLYFFQKRKTAEFVKSYLITTVK